MSFIDFIKKLLLLYRITSLGLGEGGNLKIFGILAFLHVSILPHTLAQKKSPVQCTYIPVSYIIGNPVTDP